MPEQPNARPPDVYERTVHDLLESGKTLSEVAEILGRSAAAVAACRAKLKARAASRDCESRDPPER